MEDGQGQSRATQKIEVAEETRKQIRAEAVSFGVMAVRLNRKRRLMELEKRNILGQTKKTALS